MKSKVKDRVERSSAFPVVALTTAQHSSLEGVRLGKLVVVTEGEWK